MTKSTDKALIEDKEIPAEQLVENLIENQENTNLDTSIETGDHATIVADEDGDEEVTEITEVGETETAKVDRRKTDTRRKTTSRRASDSDPTRLYLKEIEISALLTAEEEVYYARLSLKGDTKSRDKMIECN